MYLYIFLLQIYMCKLTSRTGPNMTYEQSWTTLHGKEQRKKYESNFRCYNDMVAIPQAFDAELDVGAYTQQVYAIKSSVGLGHSVKSDEAKWLQNQLAALETGVKTQQLLASLDEKKKGSNVDILNKIATSLKQLRTMKEKEEAMRGNVSLPAEGENQELPPLVGM